MCWYSRVNLSHDCLQCPDSPAYQQYVFKIAFICDDFFFSFLFLSNYWIQCTFYFTSNFGNNNRKWYNAHFNLACCLCRFVYTNFQTSVWWINKTEQIVKRAAFQNRCITKGNTTIAHINTIIILTIGLRHLVAICCSLRFFVCSPFANNEILFNPSQFLRLSNSCILQVSTQMLVFLSLDDINFIKLLSNTFNSDCLKTLCVICIRQLFKRIWNPLGFLSCK